MPASALADRASTRPKAPAIGSSEFASRISSRQRSTRLSAADRPTGRASHFRRGDGELLLRRAGAGSPSRPSDDRAGRAPYPNEPGFNFGLTGEEYAGVARTSTRPQTDDAGKSSVTLDLTDLPDLTGACANDPDQRLRAERTRGQRKHHPGDPHPTAGTRIALAGGR